MDVYATNAPLGGSWTAVAGSGMGAVRAYQQHCTPHRTNAKRRN